MEIRIRAAAASDVGRVRRSNEDAFGFDLDRGLFVVCDGVGGARAGEGGKSIRSGLRAEPLPTAS